jgi:hypothetical protein
MTKTTIPPALGEIQLDDLKTGRHDQYGNGYQAIEVVQRELETTVANPPHFSSLIAQIEVGFGRATKRLPEIFAVSSPTFYSWLFGTKTPNEQYHAKLYALAAAAEVFKKAGLIPNPLDLDRTVINGKSLLELIAEGRCGEDTAERLLRILKRGIDSRAKLDEILGGRKAPRPFSLDGDAAGSMSVTRHFISDNRIQDTRA